MLDSHLAKVMARYNYQSSTHMYMAFALAMEGEGRDGYRDQMVTCDVGVSLHSKTHPLFVKHGWHKCTVLCISVSKLVSCAFSTIPICPLKIQRILDNINGPTLCG